jgi:hypothetical protein
MTELIKYDEMCRAIDAAHEVDEVKDIRDKAVAMEAYFKVAKNPEPERRACDIRIRAERKVGELRRAEEKNKGGRPTENIPPQGGWVSTNAERREELGISKKQDEQWQALAAIPQDEFEAALAGPDKPSTGGIIKPKRDAMDKSALWLWGRLRDFERDGLLEKEQHVVLSEMTEAMRDDVLRIVPSVLRWLEGIIDD